MNFVKTGLISLCLVLSGRSVPAENLTHCEVSFSSSVYSASKKWCPVEAEQGYAQAQYTLAHMYTFGIEFLEDYAIALNWYLAAAEQGHARAQYMAGFFFYNGYGTLKNNSEAVKWYILASKQGEPDAQNQLAIMYGMGEGVLEDSVRAHMWANIASVNGIEKAAKMRTKIASWMTSADISEAQKMARECMNSNYQNCGW